MKFWLVLFGILAVVGVVGFLFFNNLHGSDMLSASDKQKALTHVLGRGAQTSPVDHSSFVTYTSSVISFVYPAWATVYEKDNTDAKKLADVLDSFHFGLLEQHMEAVVRVTSWKGFSSVDDEPGVNFRLQNRDYTEVGNHSADMISFIKTTDGLERSVFLFQNHKMVSFVVSGGSDSDNKEIFEKIKDSIKVL